MHTMFVKTLFTVVIESAKYPSENEQIKKICYTYEDILQPQRKN